MHPTRGGLAIGFFEGPELEPFDHAVRTVHVWPMAPLSDASSGRASP